MAAKVDSGAKILDALIFLAEQGITTRGEVAAYIGISPAQADRYLQTLLEKGFATNEKGKWMLGLRGYRLSFQSLESLNIRQKHLQQEINDFEELMTRAITGIEGV